VAVEDWDSVIQVRSLAGKRPNSKFATSAGSDHGIWYEGKCDCSQLAFSPGGQFLARIYRDTIELYEVATGKLLRRFANHRVSTHSLVFSPDGKLLASCARADASDDSWADTTIRLWEVASGQELLSIHLPMPIYQVTFAPDGNTLAAACEDGTIRLWEVASAKELQRFEEAGNTAYCVAFSPQGDRLASAMSNGTALIWDLRPVNRRVARPQPTPEEVPQLWATLSGDDGAATLRAIWRLGASGAEGVRLLRGQLRAIPVVEWARIRQFIRDLDHGDFAVREAASQELRAVAVQAEPLLRPALAQTDSQEVRARIQSLLQPLGGGMIRQPETLRTLRSIWVLERIGTPAARQVLDDLAHGAPGVRVTEEAEAACKRLDQRPARK
jgi:hypothetical protein